MITTRLLRHINALRCLRLLQGGASLSRADMARALGQTRATVGHAVAELAEAGLVLETETTSSPEKSAIGRPGVALRLNPGGAQFIGIEIDTRILSGVVLNLDMQVTHREAQPTGPDFHDPAAMTGRIIAMAQRLAGQNPARIHGMALAVPGLVGTQGQIVNAPILGWRNHPMQSALAQALPETWAIEVVNDAFAFAAAELAGAETPLNLLMVLLAEGIGSAHIAGGRLIAGAHGFAGELGHMRIAVQGRAAKFEALAGAAGFPSVMGQGRAVADGVATLLASHNQPETEAALTLWAEALAMGLANAAHLLDPDRIVLGGPLSALYPLVAPQVEAHLKALMLEGHARPTLHIARFGAEGAAIGAAARLRERLFTLPDLGEAALAKTA
jgi:predicted NBD/HSP70 family sugar kinase